MDWGRFEFTYRFEINDSALLITIETYKGTAYNLMFPPDWRDQLGRLNRVRAVHGTTALEGNPLSEEQVAEALDDGNTERGRTREQAQIRNAGAAQDWVRSRFDGGKEPLQLEDILQMHRLITRHSDEVNNVPGRFRRSRVVVGTAALGGVHRGAPPDDIPRLMDEFVAFINSARVQGEHPVVRALLGHFFLVTIHPFGDGNGRVSRLVEAAMLYQGGYNVHGFYGLSNYFYRNGDEYKMRLQECRKSQPFDVSPFVNFALRGFAAELGGINNFIKTKMNRLVYRNTLVRAYNKRAGRRRRVLNDREYSLLTYLLDETEPDDPFSEKPSKQISLVDLMASPYVMYTYRSVTSRTFRRELIRLAERGFILFTVPEGSDPPIIEIDFAAIGKY
jgi:fido (protein-threonine AMPylation protein)